MTNSDELMTVKIRHNEAVRLVDNQDWLANIEESGDLTLTKQQVTSNTKDEARIRRQKDLVYQLNAAKESLEIAKQEQGRQLRAFDQQLYTDAINDDNIHTVMSNSESIKAVCKQIFRLNNTISISDNILNGTVPDQVQFTISEALLTISIHNLAVMSVTKLLKPDALYNIMWVALPCDTTHIKDSGTIDDVAHEVSYSSSFTFALRMKFNKMIEYAMQPPITHNNRVWNYNP